VGVDEDCWFMCTKDKSKLKTLVMMKTITELEDDAMFSVAHNTEQSRQRLHII
jgi:hypothetical protein